MEKVQYAIEIVDKWGKPMQSFEKRVDALSRKTVDPFEGTETSIKRANAGLDESARKIDHLSKQKSAAIDKTLTWQSAIAAVGSSYLAMQAGQAVWNFTKDSIQAAAQVEKYNVTLKTMLGSTGAARDRMQEYFDIAKKTPFQLNQVVEAGNQLQAIGRYSAENLTNLGDLAAASGKPIEQALTAYAKLATGQKGEAVNMFRDLLISTEDWVKATGKGIKANGELEATTEEMIAALPGILKGKGYLGMMEAQARTTEGKMSNLEDSVFQLNEALGYKLKPTTDAFLSTAGSMVDTMKEWVEVPTPVKIAQEKAELNALVGVITDANTGEQTRNDLLKQLQQQYPEFLANLDLETVKNEELIAKLKEVNKQYEAKMRVSSMQSRVSTAEEKYQKLLDQYIDAETVAAAKADAYNLLPTIKEYQKKGYMFMPTSGDINDVQTWVGSVERSIKQASSGKLNLSDDVLQNMYDFQAAVQMMQENSSIWSGDINTLQAELDAQFRIVTKEKERLSQTERDALLLEARGKDLTNMSTYEQLFGSSKLKQSGTLKAEFEGIRQKTSDVLTELEWARLYDFMQGNLAARATGTGGGGGGGGSTIKDIQKAEDLITGGGKNVKVLNIYLDSLIASNTNVFDQGEDPASAEEFMTKLTNALQVVVNDTNYVE